MAETMEQRVERLSDLLALLDLYNERLEWLRAGVANLARVYDGYARANQGIEDDASRERFEAYTGFAEDLRRLLKGGA